MENKPKLLIVDNDKAILDSYNLLFKRHFNVETCETIKDACKKLKKSDFKVAIIDMSYPEDNEGGIKIIKFIRENNINTKAIVLTAVGSESNFQKSYEEGIFDFVEKATNGTNDILMHSVIFAASLPPEIRIFLSNENIDFFKKMESNINLSKIEIIGESLRLFHWAINEWKDKNEVGAIKGGKMNKIENLYLKYLKNKLHG